MPPIFPSSRQALITGLVLVGLLLAPGKTQAQRGLDVARDTLVESVLIHPPIPAEGQRTVRFTREHVYARKYILGDQLGRDFILMRIGPDGIMRPFEKGSEGARNEDWHTWRNPALAPFDATVTEVQRPDSTNQPGSLNADAQHGEIHFRDEEDGVTVSYVHLREIAVEEGQQVAAGAVVARVGNNGSSIAPHVHVGAWRNETPLQIQVDLYAAERGRDEKK
jgi:hypothetical protein